MTSQPPEVPPQANQPGPGPDGKPRRRRHRALKITLAVLLAGVILLAFGVPLLVSSSLVRNRVTESASRALNTEVKLAALDFGWLSGVELRGLEVANPPGFPQDQKVLQLKMAAFGWGGIQNLLGMGSGGLQIEGRAADLLVVVDENADGLTNLDKLLGRDGTEATGGPGADQESDRPDRERPREGGGGDQGGDPLERFKHWSLNLTLNRGEIEVRREGQLVDAMRGIEVRVDKPAGSATFTARVDAEVEHAMPVEAGVIQTDDRPRVPGRLMLDAEFDGATSTVDATAEVREFDLAAYAPLARAMFKPGDLEALAGVVQGTVRVQGKAGDKISAVADVTVREPRIRGGLVQWMDVRAPEWRLQSDLDLGEQNGEPMLQAITAQADLGFATARLLPDAEKAQRFSDAAGMAVAITADIGKVLAMGGPVPEDLRGSKGNVSGDILLPVDARGLPDTTDLMAQLLAALDIRLDEISASGFTASGLDMDVSLGGGNLAVTTPKAAQGSGALNGGPLQLGLTADLTDLTGKMAELTLSWQGGRVTGPTSEVLRYGVPLLAGLQKSADLTGLASIQGSLSFPPMPREGEEIMAWLNRFTGKGTLGLTDLAFQPAGPLGPLAQFIEGQTGKAGSTQLRIRDLTTDFSIREGALQHNLMKLTADSNEFGITGKTMLDGGMDYRVDLKPLLKGRGDGEKVLRYLGDAALSAGLAGTVDQPELAMPDLETMLKEALKGQLGNVLQGGLKELLGGEKKDGDGGDGQDEGQQQEGQQEQQSQGGSQGQEPTPEEKAKREVNRLLRRIGGGGGDGKR